MCSKTNSRLVVDALISITGDPSKVLRIINILSKSTFDYNKMKFKKGNKIVSILNLKGNPKGTVVINI